MLRPQLRAADPFAYRQFEEGFRGTRVIGCDRDTFTARVNEHYKRETKLVEGCDRMLFHAVLCCSIPCCVVLLHFMMRHQHLASMPDPCGVLQSVLNVLRQIRAVLQTHMHAKLHRNRRR